MKQFRLMILVTAAILIFSGCTKLELDYVIEENGTVSTTYLIAVEDQAGKLADIQHLIDAAWEQAEINGFSLSSYHDEGYTGFQADKSIKIEDLQQPGSQMLGFETLPSIISDYTWHYEPSVFQNVYKIKIDVDLRNIVDKTALDALPSDMKELALGALNSTEAKIHITLPGKPEKTNADQTNEVKGKNATRYSWTLHPGEYRTLLVESVLDKSSTKNQLLWVIGAVAGLIIVLSCFLIFRRVRKNRP